MSAIRLQRASRISYWVDTCIALILCLLKRPVVRLYFARETASWTADSVGSHIIELHLLYHISRPPSDGVEMTGRPHSRYSDEEKQAPSFSEKMPPTKDWLYTSTT